MEVGAGTQGRNLETEAERETNHGEHRLLTCSS